MSEPKLTVVVAVEYSQKNLPDILDRIAVTDGDPVEVIISCTEKNGDCSVLPDRYDNVVTVQAPANSRIPQMWAEGIRAGRGSLIALTTAHCIPGKDWISRIQSLDMPPDLVGVGGIFRNSDSASGMDWAIFLLRYRQFSNHAGRREVTEIAADNAVYRRKEILAYQELLDSGFWEPEFHACFRKRNLKLVLDPSLVVVHHNCYTFRQFAAQRVEHGMAFGRARAARLTRIHNLALLLISPALPFVFFAKIVSGSFKHREFRRPLLQSFPWLFAFVACWGFGECKGYIMEFHNRLAGLRKNDE